MKDLKALVRPNIWALKPYSSARDEYAGREASVFLDANESPYNVPNNRYPDPLQWELKEAIGRIKQVPAANIFLGNGSDEAIDLVFRTFCEPGIDNVVAIAPSYGMYEVCADTNNVAYRTVVLNEDYQLNADALLEACDAQTKVIFLCSPNNPTGNCLDSQQVLRLLQAFEGIVVIDEAYIDFATQPSYLKILHKCPNLIVLSTFSKAWGCAGIRLGMAMASEAIIALFNKVKYPYNINALTQRYALEHLKRTLEIEQWINNTIQERTRLMHAVAELPFCQRVFPSDANFFLARMTDATRIYDYLVAQGIIVRNRSKIVLCDNCLRITIGNVQENTTLLAALRRYQPA